MNNKFRCSCLFDVSATGVTTNTRMKGVPFTTTTGVVIKNTFELNFARNQQRNFDTLIQLFSMRTQVVWNSPVKMLENEKASNWGFGKAYKGNFNVWQFAFEIGSSDPWLKTSKTDFDYCYFLREDAEQIPMLLGLLETAKLEPLLVATGPETNVLFELEY